MVKCLTLIKAIYVRCCTRQFRVTLVEASEWRLQCNMSCQDLTRSGRSLGVSG